VEGAGIAPAQCGIRTVIGIEQDVEFFCDDHGRYSDSELLPSRIQRSPALWQAVILDGMVVLNSSGRSSSSALDQT
jgi:hypothetical protein